ncbi:MAG: hypothetical protein ACXVP5_11680, partial [Tumebacillaceae bacterium]
SDEFDHDANLIYGQPHTAALLDVNDKLRGLEGKPNKEAEIMTHLGTLSGLTKNKDIPGLDPSLWTEVDTEEKVAIVQNLLPTRPVLQGKSIHKEVVRKALVPLIKLPKDGDVYTLLTHLKSGANSTTSAEIIVNGFSVTAKNKTATGGLRVSRAGTTLDVENQFPQQRSTLKKVDVSSEIVDMMKEHVNTIKTMLGL